jgi:hypothetical protein
MRRNCKLIVRLIDLLKKISNLPKQIKRPSRTRVTSKIYLYVL